MKKNLTEKTIAIIGEVKTVDTKEKVANITIVSKEYDSDAKEEKEVEYKVAAWNSDDTTKPQMRDRVSKLNLVGSTVMLICCEGEKELSLNAIVFANGEYAYKNEEFKNTLLFTKVYKPQDLENIFRVSCPLKQRGSDDPKWVSACFSKKKDKNGMASRLAKCMQDGALVFIQASEIAEGEYNGKPSYSCWIHNFNVIQFPERKEENGEN